MYNYCILRALYYASLSFLFYAAVQTEHWNVTPSPWVLCSWNMWILPGCFWKLRMTKMRRSLRTSELTSAPWSPTSSNAYQVLLQLA